MNKAILKTLAYFNIFDYPLTLVEVWKWLYGYKVSINEVREALDSLSDRVGEKNGFYFLKSREEIIATRLKRYSIAEDKYNKAKSIIKVLSKIPFIKMIAVCNTLAYSNTDIKGDIDLFIIAKKNRLWLTRLLVVGWLKFKNQRPIPGNKKDAIDTNFFLSETDLNVDYLGIRSNDQDNNLSLVYWLDQLVPIYDRDNTYNRFMDANSWLKEYLPNSIGYELNDRRVIKSNLYSKIVGWLLNIFSFEYLAKAFQLTIMPVRLKQIMNKDSRVIVNEKLLKFHQEDKRVDYLRIWQEKLNEIS